MQWERDGYVVTDDRARLDLAVIHAFLAGESYWATGHSARRSSRAPSTIRSASASTAARSRWDSRAW